jgi:hypothetical protein
MRSLAHPTPALALFAALLSGCATGSTFRSGVGDALLEAPPYVATSGAQVRGLRVAHAPITYQRGATQASLFDPADGPESPVAELLARMNAYLDSLGATSPLAVAPTGTPPDVHFSCETDTSGECDPGPSRFPLERDEPRMRLAVGRPSRQWVTLLGDGLEEAGADAALVLTLEVGRYWPRQKNLKGDKIVELGTYHTAGVPWLTALDRPVMVLQLTGALVGPDGRAMRIAAEGMLAVRTNLLLGSLGVQELISDADVERLLDLRMTDAPGSPLVWQAALGTLIAELTAQPRLAVR